MTRIIAIIPARGGSKGIPRKNLVPFCGKPLVAWSIEAALATRRIDRVVVSTDDDAIAGVAAEYGARVVRRPPEISGDTATSEDALQHTLDYLEQTEGYVPDLVVFLQATSPIRQPADIDSAIDTLQREQADSLFTARHVEGFVWKAGAQGVVPVNYDPANRKVRQDLSDRILEENGSIYVFKPWVLRQHRSRLGGKITVHRMNEFDSFQVDTPSDVVRLAQLAAIRRPGTVPDLRQVRLLVTDFDGVMTDNRVLVGEDGKESVHCNRADSLGLERVKEAGVAVVVLSKETNPVVHARCRKLQIECIAGCDDKGSALEELVARRSLSLDQVAYVGNDVNDLACLRIAGCPIAVADAVPEVRSICRLVTSAPGGHGAIREVTDWILAARTSPSS